MKTLARIVLAWLVLAALPVQGFAAAAMLSCGPGHEEMAGAVEVRHAHASHGAHGTAEPEAMGHATAPAATPLAAAGAFKCSACAACCVATALPASPLIVAAQRPTAEAIPERRQPSGDFVVERLEHPPRGFFA
ncbi:MAG: hypothetical protein M9907_17270 [Burkholderiaceae bacterium]|nr:hypothetical protein [Burkholderiaceae bacterium]